MHDLCLTSTKNAFSKKKRKKNGKERDHLLYMYLMIIIQVVNNSVLHLQKKPFGSIE